MRAILALADDHEVRVALAVVAALGFCLVLGCIPYLAFEVSWWRERWRYRKASAARWQASKERCAIHERFRVWWLIAEGMVPPTPPRITSARGGWTADA